MSSVPLLATVNASLNAIAAVFLGAGFYFIRRRQIAAHRVCMLIAFAVSVVFLVCYVTYHYPGRRRSLSGPRRGQTDLLHDPHLAHHSGGDHRPTGNHDSFARAALTLRQASPHRPLDLADMDVRVGDRSDRVPDGVPHLRPADYSLAATDRSGRFGHAAPARTGHPRGLPVWGASRLGAGS